ncbi:MAG: tRNA lysidine(34) synthetase [Bacillota bacterium]|jgi:tRNA 2-thiocytidine biosynthesis protein TtcA
MRYDFNELFKRSKKAIIKYEMIADEKSIMVGLSGGKDSAALLYVLKKFQPISKYKYRLAAGHVSLGFPEEDITVLKDFCQRLEIPFLEEKTAIGELVFQVKKENNPCSLCAKMRRGALNSLAKTNGYDKVALAHHQDDVLETLLLKTFFEGRLGSFNPVTYLDKKDLTVIRPFIYVPESLISYIVQKEQIPTVKSRCPINGQTKRQDMKEILARIEILEPSVKDRGIGALEKIFGDAWDGQKTAKESLP